MDKLKIFLHCFFVLVFLIKNVATSEVMGSSHKYGHQKLFVFGDSYADTGNLGKIENVAPSWYKPYGMTFPHKPTGRFSDGRVSTDYIAFFLRIKSPVPYKYRKVSPTHPYGMNFAVAGSGVFDTGNFQRNLSAQIDTFQSQINEGVFSHHDISSSIAYIAISGNDYSHYLESHNISELLAFVGDVTAQMAVELKRIGEIGVRKVVAANLSPLECIPELTRTGSNYTKCDDRYAVGTRHHNELLEKVVGVLNRESKNRAEFLVLDLYSAFESVMRPPGEGGRRLKHVMRPCCEGNTVDLSCGLVDEKGDAVYTVCSNPEDYFYFDSEHPTQAAWSAVFQAVQPWLRQHL